MAAFKTKPLAVKLTRSQLIEKLVYVEGRPLSYKDYPFMRAILDKDWPELLLKCSRQVGKSVSQSALMITNSIVGCPVPEGEPFKPFRSYYISPMQEQTHRFSNTRLGKMIDFSPMVQGLLVKPGDPQRVLLKVFKNGSEVALSYALDDPDRARGPSADQVLYDEVQDINMEAVVPVVNQCTANSDLGYIIFAGTPKSLENGIEIKWSMSTQFEWVMKCEGCNKYDFIDSEKNIGLTGPICKGCGHAINPVDGRWVAMRAGEKCAGFHISEPMLVRNLTKPERWQRIVDKLNDPLISISKFRNEVLGVSDAVGSRLLSKDECEALCADYSMNSQPTPELMRDVNGQFVVAGIDWSGHGSPGTTKGAGLKSYTVLWIWAPMTTDGRLKCLYYRVYPEGSNPVANVEDIVKVCLDFNVQLVAGDAGEGALANALLRDKLGTHKVIQVQHGAHPRPIQWNGKDRFLLDRTMVIDNYMMDLKLRRMVFPRLSQSKLAIDHILAEYEESLTSTSQERKVWRHAPNIPDDALQAGLYGWVAFNVKAGIGPYYSRS